MTIFLVDAIDKEKADPCGMTTKKGNDNGKGEAFGVMTKNQSVASSVWKSGAG
jgi:hypothetical protein